MIRSMTGFGAGRASAGGCEIRVEAASVNGRGLNVKVRLPEALAGCHPLVESRVRERLDRGSLTVTAELRQAPGRRRVRLDARLLAEYAREFEAARKKVKNLPPPDWTALTSLPGVLVSLRDDGALGKALLKALDQALAACEKDRAREGSATAKACQGLLVDAEKALGRAQSARQPALEGYRARMSERLKAALAREGLAVSALDADLRRELVLFSERADVAEEVSRLETHLKEARRCLGGSSPAGRRLDFLAQEMMREGNTLGSKSLDGALALAAVDLKTALDRFKEQVQNVE